MLLKCELNPNSCCLYGSVHFSLFSQCSWLSQYKHKHQRCMSHGEMNYPHFHDSDMLLCLVLQSPDSSTTLPHSSTRPRPSPPTNLHPSRATSPLPSNRRHHHSQLHLPTPWLWVSSEAAKHKQAQLQWAFCLICNSCKTVLTVIGNAVVLSWLLLNPLGVCALIMQTGRVWSNESNWPPTLILH